MMNPPKSRNRRMSYPLKPAYQNRGRLVPIC